MCAERDPNRELPPSPKRPGQQQITNVCAGDQQHQRDQAEQQRQKRLRKTPLRADATSTAVSEHPDMGMVTSRMRGPGPACARRSGETLTARFN